MTRVVVDASAIVAGLMADGRARHMLLHGQASYYAPAHVHEEIREHLPELAQRAKVPEATLAAVLDDLLARVEILPRTYYASSMPEARQRVAKAHAEGDEDDVALALALEAPIWTFDKDFQRTPGIRLVSLDELARMQP